VQRAEEAIGWRGMSCYAEREKNEGGFHFRNLR
jgi:hypothetical protein